MRQMPIIFVVLIASILVGFRSHAAPIEAGFPAIIQKGIAEFERSGSVMAFNAWERGGLLEGDNGTPAKMRRFNEMIDLLGPYRSAEKIQTKTMGKSSQFVYVALNFKRGALFMRFWLFRGESDWVVQNFTFSPSPESIMPWLAIEGTQGPAEQ